MSKNDRLLCLAAAILTGLFIALVPYIVHS